MTNEPNYDRIDAAISELSQALAECEGIGSAFADDSKVPLPMIAEFYFHMKNRHDQIDDIKKRAYKLADRFNKQVIPSRLREGNTDGFRVPTIARSFSIVTKTSASMPDKEKGLEWLRQRGQEDMIQPTVNAGTLSSYCRNLLIEEGIEPPEDIIKVSTYETTSMTKYRVKD